MKNLTRTVAVVLIIAATFLVYWPALRNGFVWDDTALILRDPLIRSWFNIPAGFRHFLFLDATASNFYRPIQRLSFTADYQLYGFAEPAGWHLTSILVHACAAAALFFFAEKMLARLVAERLGERTRFAIALGVAVLWAIHPLHTSAVTYVSGRADSLAAFFGFTGLVLGLASLDSRWRPWTWKLGAAAGFSLALLSKESGVIFLLIWLLVLASRRVTWRVFVSWGLIGAALIGGYCALRFTAQKTPPPPPPPTPVAIRPILAARAVAEYASLLVAPITLRMERDVSTRPQDSFDGTMRNARAREYQTLAGVLLIIGLGAWWWRARRVVPLAAFCLAAFLVAYLPISNVFSLNATVAEHWLYVPSAFLFLAAALTATDAFVRATGAGARATARIAVAVGMAWAAALGVRTFLRQEDWRDQRTFIERTIAAGGDSARMCMNLGNVESNAGHHGEAIALYRQALRRAPDQALIWLGFANVLVRVRDFEAAREALAHAGKSPLLTADCYQLRAVLDHVELGIDSGDYLRDAMDFAPERWGIRKHYIEYLIERGDLEEAQRELGDFIEQHPFRAESWKLLGGLLETMQRRELALAAYEQAALRDVRDEELPAALARLRAVK